MPNRVRETVVDRIDWSSLSHMTYDPSRCSSLIDEVIAFDPASDGGGLATFVDRDTFGVGTAMDAVVLTNALNFQYGDHYTGDVYRTTYDGDSYYGANALAASIERELTTNPDWFDADQLASLTVDDVERIFSGSPPLPWLSKRHDMLTHLGEQLQAQGLTRFHENILDRDVVRPFDDGDGFVDWLVSAFPLPFSDSRTYQGETLYFDKKAQLVCSVLAGRFGDGDPLEFTGMAELTVFADYLIPALFRDVGAFQYADSLAEAVDERDYIPEDSAEEVELRIATVLAGEDLLSIVNEQLENPLTPNELDYILWSIAREKDLRHHLTRTTSY